MTPNPALPCFFLENKMVPDTISLDTISLPTRRYLRVG